MPRETCYWTRKLELELVEFVRQREFIWKPFSNTNHQILQKYKAYAEFAAKLGRGYSARTVRDRWVNIRSTFNHNLRRVDKSKETATSPEEVYVPCWPLWKPLQFLREVSKKDDTNNSEDYPQQLIEIHATQNNVRVKEESQSDTEELEFEIRQRDHRTDRPRRRRKLKTPLKKLRKGNKCMSFLNDLLIAMKPLTAPPSPDRNVQYWFFGRHVAERLNAMREIDATSACRDILSLLNKSESINSSAIKMEDDISD
ncbi:uncharacterized protein [Battus philenor]|uniref:uncharacterized protein n=1 Tax=Battus philenor TaxID=42288 RepID=UPI0035CEC484